MSGLNVVVVGVIGQVGRVMRTFLAERDFPIETIRFFSSLRFSGTTLEWKGQYTTVEDVAISGFSGTDTAVFSVGASASREYTPKFAAQGAAIVDNSFAQRRDPEIPLVVSEVNPEDATKRPKDIIANPNCTTMTAMPVLRPLVDRAGGPERLFVSSYQAASGSGVKGVQELVSQTCPGVSQDLAALALDGCVITLPEPEVCVAPIAFGVAPLAGSIVGDGSEEIDEEQKLRSESRRISYIPDLYMSGTCVRVLVLTGHTLTTHAELSGTTTADGACEVLVSAPGVRLVEAPTPPEVTRRDEVFCGRTRQGQVVEGNRGLVLVLSGNNLRKGVALNAIQVAEVVVKESPG